VKFDLEHPQFMLNDNSIDEIRAIDVLEHIHNLIPLMNECHRVIGEKKPFNIEVPKFPSDQSVSDPTHVRFFIPDTFKYFSEYQDSMSLYGIKEWQIVEMDITNTRIVTTLNKV